VGGEVKTVEMHHEEVPKAEPGDNVGFNVRGLGKDDIRRGDVCGPADDPPSVAETFKAQVVVMQHPSVITAGYTPVFHAHTAQVACTIEEINQKIDPASGEVAEENPDFIKSGDAAVVTVRPQKPLSIEPSGEIPELGSFAIRDMGQTIAGKQGSRSQRAIIDAAGTRPPRRHEPRGPRRHLRRRPRIADSTGGCPVRPDPATDEDARDPVAKVPGR